MKVMVVDSGRGSNTGQVHQLREDLGLLEDDVLYWLSWNLPSEPLPVEQHLVLGPNLRHLGVARQCETASGARPGEDIHRADMTDQGASVDEADLVDEQLEEQLPESVQPHHHAEDAPPVAAGPAHVSGTALRHSRAQPAPSRSTGLAYVMKGTRNVLRRNWRPLKTWLVTNERRPVQIAVGVAQAVYPGADDRFGLAAYRSRAVARLAEDCDVILSHDTRSQAATWLIGRKVPGPALVTGVAAARRVVAERRAAGRG